MKAITKRMTFKKCGCDSDYNMFVHKKDSNVGICRNGLNEFVRIPKKAKKIHLTATMIEQSEDWLPIQLCHLDDNTVKVDSNDRLITTKLAELIGKVFSTKQFWVMFEWS